MRIRRSSFILVAAAILLCCWFIQRSPFESSPSVVTSKPWPPTQPPVTQLVSSADGAVRQQGLLVFERNLGPSSGTVEGPIWSDYWQAPVQIYSRSIRIVIESEAPPDLTLVGFLDADDSELDAFAECNPDPRDTGWVIELDDHDTACVVHYDSDAGSWFIEAEIPTYLTIAKVTLSVIWHPTSEQRSDVMHAQDTSLTASWIFVASIREDV